MEGTGNGLGFGVVWMSWNGVVAAISPGRSHAFGSSQLQRPSDATEGLGSRRWSCRPSVGHRAETWWSPSHSLWKETRKAGCPGSIAAFGASPTASIDPNVFNFLRNDLDRLNGRDFMSSKMCYPVFTQGDTSSIGIDELQLLLLKNALLLGVDFQLGLSYEDADIVLDPKTQKPQWQVKFSCDDLAAEHGGLVPGLHSRCFDVLMGCDGARSKVRESQAQIFGEVDKRESHWNLLMESGRAQRFFFSFGSVHVRSIYFEIWFKYTPFFPKKSVFSHFGSTKTPSEEFQKDDWCCRPTSRRFRGSAWRSWVSLVARSLLTWRGRIWRVAPEIWWGLNYYKASYHNYVIFTPSKEDLQQAGFSGSIYSFHDGRDKVNPNKAEEKLRLKQWVLERCKEVGIPVDETLSNGGFVEEPNDVMAFWLLRNLEMQKELCIQLASTRLWHRDAWSLEWHFFGATHWPRWRCCHRAVLDCRCGLAAGLEWSHGTLAIWLTTSTTWIFQVGHRWHHKKTSMRRKIMPILLISLDHCVCFSCKSQVFLRPARCCSPRGPGRRSWFSMSSCLMYIYYLP